MLKKPYCKFNLANLFNNVNKDNLNVKSNEMK